MTFFGKDLEKILSDKVFGDESFGVNSAGESYQIRGMMTVSYRPEKLGKHMMLGTANHAMMITSEEDAKKISLGDVISCRGLKFQVSDLQSDMFGGVIVIFTSEVSRGFIP